MTADVTFLSDAAVLTVDDRTVARAETPTVPALHQVSALEHVLAELDPGKVPAQDPVRSRIFRAVSRVMRALLAASICRVPALRYPERVHPSRNAAAVAATTIEAAAAQHTTLPDQRLAADMVIRLAKAAIALNEEIAEIGTLIESRFRQQDA